MFNTSRGNQREIDRAYQGNNLQNVQSGTWSSGIFDCYNDEEICWWTCWCAMLVMARTNDQFQLCSSLRTLCGVFFIGVLYILSLYNVFPGAPVVLLLLVCLVPWYFAYNRTSIRNRLGINGNMCGDCGMHCCCNSCALCQEAREARAAGLADLDLVSGEVLTLLPVASLDTYNPMVDGLDASTGGPNTAGGSTAAYSNNINTSRHDKIE